MARAKKVVSPLPERQSQSEDTDVADVAGKSAQSDSESQPAPSSHNIATLGAKPKTRKRAPAKSNSASPAITSSPNVTPQPEQTSRRKGGNKRKWTHEYCLTCTRYGRACSGKRDSEEGCATCREPDRSKGEKLRECLWADPEAGIYEYEHARAIFKSAQAEARALRAKPASARRQNSSNLAPSTTVLATDPSHTFGNTSTSTEDVFIAEQWHETSRPLDLKPPALSRPSYYSELAEQLEVDHVEGTHIDEPQYVTDAHMPGVLQTHMLGVHAPELTIITLNSDNEEQVIRIPSHLRPAIASSSQALSAPIGGYPVAPRTAHFDADLNSHVQVNQKGRASHKTIQTPLIAYRSAYDSHPAATPHQDHLLAHNNYVVQSSGGNPAPAYLPDQHSYISDDHLSRRWLNEGRKIQSVGGVEWNSRGWKPTSEPADRATVRASTSDSSTLSSFVSMEDIMLRDDNSNKSIDIVAYNDAMTYCGPRATSLTAAYGLASRTAIALNDNSALHLGLSDIHVNGAPKASYYAIDAPTQAHGERSKSFAYPGEIVIQEDEEGANTSDGDSELTDDEGKFKSIPSKLRKLLSRSRVTKVIIGDDIFEVRPKQQTSSKHVHKTQAKHRTTLRGSKSKAKGKQVARPEDSEGEDLTSDEACVRDPLSGAVKNEHTGKLAPIRIKLVFKRGTADDSLQQLEAENTPLAVTNIDTLIDNTLMGDASALAEDVEMPDE